MTLAFRQERPHAATRNVFQSVVLVAGIAAITTVSAYIFFSGWNGVIWSLLGVTIFAMFAPRVAPDAIMAMFKARAADPLQARDSIDIVKALADRAGLRTPPKLYIIPSATLNAFAIGSRDSAVIGVTEGLLRKLELRELAGVLAHEMTHVRNNDIWVMSLADMFSRLTRVMSFTAVFLAVLNLLGGRPFPWAGVLLLYFAPTLSSLLQLALSRSREYDADLGAVELTGDPQALASALSKLERYQGRLWEDMVMPNRRMPLPSVLRTHPITADRIGRILSGNNGADISPLPISNPGGHALRQMTMPAGPRFHWTGFWF